MTRALVPLCVLSLAAAANAQSVQFRIVERTGQTIWSAADPVLDFAVQARVINATGNAGLGNFTFDIVAPGEPDSNGTLLRLLTSNLDGTYAANPGQTLNQLVGRGGLASQYAYLAGITSSFNGMINTSSGSFTNTAGNQEIGLITGSPTGNSLLAQADLDFDGNPDTYPGTGATAPLDPAYADTYLGANGHWIDVYRFKYTLSNLSPRILTFTLQNASAQVATGLQLANGLWGPVQTNAADINVSGVTFVLPAPSSACALALGAAWAGRRRRRD